MTAKLAIFFHCFIYYGEPPALNLNAINIIDEQWTQVRTSGLLDAAADIVIGLNGGDESADVARLVFPPKAKLVMHGLASKAENLTIVEIEKWVPTHPDYYVLYFHSKGATHDPSIPYAAYSASWRRTMMGHLVGNWQQCITDLNSGYEAAGCNWLTGMGWDKSQNIFGGNFFWARASYLQTLPSIYNRQRIKDSGISSSESRYEAEVWVGNGARLPIVKVYHPGGM